MWPDSWMEMCAEFVLQLDLSQGAIPLYCLKPLLDQKSGVLHNRMYRETEVLYCKSSETSGLERLWAFKTTGN
jgi:hypothetical protein